jgi:uncharacterized protein
VIAVDTNILVYAHRRDSVWHTRARDRIAELAESGMRFGVPLHCLVEFYACVTKYYRSTPEQAIAQIDAWGQAPSFAILSDDLPTWATLRGLLLAGRTHGDHAFDMRIVAVCTRHGVTELWTNDRGISSLPGLFVTNPLIDIQPTGAREPGAAWAPANARPAAIRKPSDVRGTTGRPRRRGSWRRPSGSTSS